MVVVGEAAEATTLLLDCRGLLRSLRLLPLMTLLPPPPPQPRMVVKVAVAVLQTRMKVTCLLAHLTATHNQMGLSEVAPLLVVVLVMLLAVAVAVVILAQTEHPPRRKIKASAAVAAALLLFSGGGALRAITVLAV
jgi:hypothetical protein